MMIVYIYVIFSYSSTVHIHLYGLIVEFKVSQNYQEKETVAQ